MNSVGEFMRIGDFDVPVGPSISHLPITPTSSWTSPTALEIRRSRRSQRESIVHLSRTNPHLTNISRAKAQFNAVFPLGSIFQIWKKGIPIWVNTNKDISTSHRDNFQTYGRRRHQARQTFSLSQRIFLIRKGQLNESTAHHELQPLDQAHTHTPFCLAIPVPDCPPKTVGEEFGLRQARLRLRILFTAQLRSAMVFLQDKLTLVDWKINIRKSVEIIKEY